MSKNDSKLVTKVSSLIEGQVPDFVQSDHPQFVKFLTVLGASSEKNSILIFPTSVSNNAVVIFFY